MQYKSKRSKATDIPASVKKRVFERDKGRCVICGNNYNVMPSSHILSRAKGGKGIEENIVTMCTNFTPNKCHYYFDNGTKEQRDFMMKKIEKYMKKIYGENWDISNNKYIKK